jgi:hypothetical protein
VAVDITPKLFPLNMPGGFSANMAEKAHDPLHSRALVLSDGVTTLAMVVVDNLGAGPEIVDEVKALASAKTGIPVDKMLICSTHTHTGPSLNKRSDAATAYWKVFVDGVAGSIIQAHAALKPAAFGAAAHPLPENRAGVVHGSVTAGGSGKKTSEGKRIPSIDYFVTALPALRRTCSASYRIPLPL